MFSRFWLGLPTVSMAEDGRLRDCGAFPVQVSSFLTRCAQAFTQQRFGISSLE